MYMDVYKEQKEFLMLFRMREREGNKQEQVEVEKKVFHLFYLYYDYFYVILQLLKVKELKQ